MGKKSFQLVDELRSLLAQGGAASQEAIRLALESKGFETNQSQISRLLRKIGAVKMLNSQGVAVYALPKDPAPPQPRTLLSQLVFDVVHNESMIVIETTPGAASMIARMIDHASLVDKILGTISGDDTVFIAPKSTKNIKSLSEEIRRLLIQ